MANENTRSNVRQRQTANEYAESVRQWITQYNVWHQTTMFQMTFPYYMMGCMSAQSMNSPAQTTNNTSPAHQSSTGQHNRRVFITVNRTQHSKHTPNVAYKEHGI